MRRLLFRLSLMIVLAPMTALAVSGIATACERCRMLGTTAFHEPSLGGDDAEDAFTAPNIDDEQGGSGEFAPTSYKWPQPNGLGSPVVVTYSFQNMFDNGLRGPGAVPGPNGMFLPNGEPLPAALIRASIEEALGLWASVAPLTFIEVEDDGLTYAQGSTQYGDIRFRHVYINGTDPPPPADPVAKARAWYPTGGQLAGDVEFDHGDPWQEVGSRAIPDILGAAIHEIGHTLGLAHTSVSTANMYWIFTRYSGLGTGALHPDDIAGIQYIYGAGEGRVVPLVPEPATATLLLIVLFCWPARRLR